MLVKIVGITFERGKAVAMCHPMGRGTGLVARQHPVTLVIPREDGIKTLEKMRDSEVNGEITA